MRTLSETEARGVGPTGANFEPVLEAEAGASEAAEVSVDGTAASATDSHASPVEADQVQPAKPDASTAGPTPAPTEVTTTEAARPTIPSGKPNPDAKPRGRVTKINPKDTPANQVAYARENESAELLAKQGYDVEQNPPSPAGSRKNPDYKIEGEYFDNYAPTAKSPRSIWTGVGKKVKKDQAARIVLNLDDNAVDLDALAKQFAEWPIDGLEQVLVVRQGTVSQLVP
ncbi:MAG: hypothetical protein H6708_29595 [Kofleriaceae bacterium]|nr:hypothetical protein [Kofleriaceae bacterium]